MRIDALISLIASGESLHLELKSQDVSVNKITEAVCGFLNAEGGYLLIGVAQDQSVTGVNNASVVARKIERALEELISPTALWSVTVDQVDNGELIVVSIPPGSRPPYTCRGVIYARRAEGPRTFTAESDQVAGIIKERVDTGTLWERLPATGLELEDIDEKEVQETVRTTFQRRPGLFSDQPETSSVLEEFGLSHYGRLSNACAVLFATSPERLLPQIRVRATAFSTDKGGDYLDNQLFEGNVFKLLESLLNFIQRNTSISSSFEEGKLERTDKPVYPFPAIREGLLNALAHRDYSRYDGGLSLGIYPDRLEIWNSGSLPEGMKVGDLKKTHPSIPHNPDIAYVLYLRVLIERVGRGTLKIIEECQLAGLRQPKWSQDKFGVTLTIYSASSTLQKQSISVRLNERQTALVTKMNPGQQITLSEYSGQVSDQAAKRTARRDLAQLVVGGWFERKGPTRSLYYVRTEKKL